MAMARPVVMTTNTFLDIADAGVGIAVAPDDREGWHEAIALLAGDVTLAAEMGERARKLCESEFSMSDYSERVADALIGASGRTGRAHGGTS
jgi:glycosyltransferase involved in cell wall biosynthesis